MTFQFRDNKTSIRNIYRFAVCAVSFTLLLFCGALRFSEEFTAEKLAKSFLFSVSATPMQTDEVTPEKEIPHYVGNDAEVTPAPQTQSAEYTYPITALNLSCAGDRFALRNGETDYSPDLEVLLAAKYPASLAGVSVGEDPLVLVIHTHATECFCEEGADGYDDGTSFRSKDTEKNMVAVGTEFCRELEAHGIKTIHCTELFDDPDYNASYANSLSAVRGYLKKYPSVKYIFDLHRDAIIRENGEMIKPLCEVDGVNAAQIMLVVGTDARGADHPNWQENLNVALKLHNTMCDRCPTLMRSIDLRGASFNQQYGAGFLLAEIGSCGNTLDEAKNAARLLGGGVAEIIERYGN